jgi:hypothetical protein
MSKMRETIKTSVATRVKNVFFKNVFFNRSYTPGDLVLVQKEKRFKSVSFKKIKIKDCSFEESIIVTIFSEFGCESIAIHYLIPEIIKKNPNKKIIIVGWQGRSFLYSHLVHEFWEISADFMFLKDYAKAFHNDSKNVKWIEKSLTQYGKVITSLELGNMALLVKCRKCGSTFGADRKCFECSFCKSDDLKHSFFSDPVKAKEKYVPVPHSSLKYYKKAKKLVKKNTVALFVRGRKAYGRNLTPEHYRQIVDDLIKLGFNVIWLGEKYTTFDLQNDYKDKFINLCNHPDFDDIQFVLAVLRKCVFSLQFWTASTRLSAMVNLPFILIESPDQIIGRGQEGQRIILTTREESKKKIIFCNHQKVIDNFWDFKGLLKWQIYNFIKIGDYSDVIGLVDNFDAVKTNYLHNNNFWQEAFKKSTNIF